MPSVEIGSDTWLVNGLKLFVHRFRDASVAPSGISLLLLHGIYDAGSTWDLVASTLARAGHDVLAPDLRGFGKSDWIGPGGYYHFPDYVADVAALVDEVNPSRLCVVGHSMGGSIAALYVATHPGRVERLALLEGIGPPAMPSSIAVDRMQAWLRDLKRIDRAPRPLASMEDAVARLAANNSSVPHDVLVTRARLLTRMDASGRLIWAHDPLHKTISPATFRVEEFGEFLAKITCPTLLVSGGARGWQPPDAEERAGRIGGVVRRVDLPNAGHMMHWTEPAALARELIGFFGEQAGGR
jgi:pimeloyl-ACP methyl ester carboxylesterase